MTTLPVEQYESMEISEAFLLDRPSEEPATKRVPGGCVLMFNFIFRLDYTPRDVFDLDSFMEQAVEMSPNQWENRLQCLRWCQEALKDLERFLREVAVEYSQRNGMLQDPHQSTDPRAQKWDVEPLLPNQCTAFLYDCHRSRHTTLSRIVGVLGPMESQIEELASQFNMQCL